MIVWVLTRGCKFEGGNVVCVCATLESGLAVAQKHMDREVELIASLSTPEDPCKTYFTKDIEKRNLHGWTEHYCFMSAGKWVDTGHDFLQLRAYNVCC